MQTPRDSYALGAALLAEGTNANTYKTTAALPYVVEGRTYSKAATDNIAFAAFTGTSFTALAAKQTCAFFFMIDAAGAITAIQSPIVPSTAGTGYRAGAWEWPERPSHACIGALVVRTDNAATFTAGSTDLGAADVVDTFYDNAGDYGRPITY